MMKLEDLRYDNLGKIYCWCPSRSSIGGEKAKIHLSFHEVSIKAFYLTCQSIEQIENSNDMINPGKESMTAVMLWFLSLEAFINSLLKMVCLKNGLAFSKYKDKKLEGRLQIFIDLAQLDKKVFWDSGIQSKMQEFEQYRNEIFHDRYFGKELYFKKTFFSKIPFLCNQVDAIQSLLICLETFSMFACTIRGLNLMPSIFVEKDETFFFRKLDLLYEELIKPYFRQVLNKHNLSTALILDYPRTTLLPSSIITNDDFKILIKSTPNGATTPILNQQRTSIGRTLFDTIKNSQELDSLKFQLPNYMASE